MSFLAPWLLGGVALAGVPIVIHLLNRRRFTVVEWGPMRYLRKTLRTNRRRLQLEQWVLLALRALLVALLFVALAKPMAASTGLSGWLSGGGGPGGGGRVSRVLVIDDSLSMGLRGGGRNAGESALDRAKAAAVTLVESIGAQDTLTVMTASRPGEPLVANVALEGAGKAGVVELIRALEGRDTADGWATVLASVRGALAGAPYGQREVTVVTDPRGPAWSAGLTGEAEALAAEGVDRVRVVDVGALGGGAAPAGQGNAALLSLTADDAVVVAGEATRLTAKVRWDGVRGSGGGQPERAVLAVNDEERAVELPALEPGVEVEVPLTVTFTEPGDQRVALRLGDDALPGDNERRVVVGVRDGVRVLLVDGEPAAEARDGETFFLNWALRAGGRPFAVERVVDSVWLEGEGGGMEGVEGEGWPDVLVLANVASLPPERARGVIERVAGGMGLMVFVGDLVDVESYNERLYAGGAGGEGVEGGEGVLPGRLEPAEDAAEGARGLTVTAGPGGALASLAAVPSERFGQVVPTRWMGLTLAESSEEVDAGDAARVPMRWSGGWQPAVVEGQFGAGKVLWWLTTADRAWSNWPTDPSFVLAVREGARAVAGGGGDGRVNRTVGEALSVAFEAGRAVTSAAVSGPGGAGPVAVGRGEPVAPGEPTGAVVRYEPTDRAGWYTLSWEAPGPSLTPSERVFALNPDAAESDLTRVADGVIEAALEPLAVTVTRVGGVAGDDEASGDRPWWRMALGGVLALVVVESGFAAWVGREK